MRVLHHFSSQKYYLCLAMAKQALNFTQFASYLPKGVIDEIKKWFEKYSIQLIITRERKSILGNYTHPHARQAYHKITINGNQNPYSFLITLLHELAHLQAFVTYGLKIAPHGKEWQEVYRNIIKHYLGKGVFPPDIESVLLQSLTRVRAGSCTDKHLYKALAQYDVEPVDGLKWVEELQPDTYFVDRNGKVYQLKHKRRTRFLCEQLPSRKQYLFQPVARVRPISAELVAAKGLLD